ncbi:MAG: hypothetical protein ACYCXG_05840 [Acidiferrobacter sp.]
MSGIRVFAIILVVVGIFAAAYGGFSYHTKSQAVRVGPVSLSVQHQHHVNIPLWVGAGAVVVGGVLLLVASRGSARSPRLG